MQTVLRSAPNVSERNLLKQQLHECHKDINEIFFTVVLYLMVNKVV